MFFFSYRIYGFIYMLHDVKSVEHQLLQRRWNIIKHRLPICCRHINADCLYPQQFVPFKLIPIALQTLFALAVSNFSSKSPLYRSLFYPVSFIPANTQQSTGSRYRALPQYCYRKTLEKLREAPLLLCPWNLYRLRSMLTTLYPRNLAHYYCLELATVKMPPASLRILMDMHSIPAYRTGPFRIAISYLYFYLPFRHLQPYCRYIPRVLQP